LDIVSGGRLKVGLGLGWSIDELEAAGDPMDARGRRADEFLAVLKAVWGPDPVSFAEQFSRVAPSVIGAKPVQKPHPPVYLAAYTPDALRRAAQFANGWNASGVPLHEMSSAMAALCAMAVAAGREASEMKLMVRANLHVTEHALGADRSVFTGSLEEIGEDVRACQAMGAAQVFFDMTFTPQGSSMPTLLWSMKRLFREVREMAPFSGQAI
jgi:alkanesulfonate monooxygenase SsuD/methylene tetrahydromethanopterin reductase-like flavin-dependent oxidoreductase (luciferase family)